MIGSRLTREGGPLTRTEELSDLYQAWFLFGILGLLITFYGVHEVRLTSRSATTRQAVQVTDLESGQAPDQPYSRIEKHYAIYEESAYWLEDGLVTKTLYPIVSGEHRD